MKRCAPTATVSAWLQVSPSPDYKDVARSAVSTEMVGQAVSVMLEDGHGLGQRQRQQVQLSISSDCRY